jgi:DNA-binding LytR/AlgR family response regulator
MINAVIIDDEPIARHIIRTYAERIPFIKIVKEFNDPIPALEYINKSTLDLIIVDINMPSLSGLDMLHLIDQRPYVIIASAYKEHAIRGFELAVCDYLLKPFSFERFLMSISRVNNLLNSRPYKVSEEVKLPVNNKESFIFLKSGKNLFKVDVIDILFVQAYGNYLNFYTISDKIMVLQSLTSLEKELNYDYFIRIHKSTIINKNHISKISGNEIFIKGHKIQIGRNYKKYVDDLIKKRL